MKETILIVEDEKSISDSIAYSLEQEGFVVRLAFNASEALECFTSSAPSLIILDVGLPDRSGFDLCREIRKLSEVPILFLTARSEEVDKVVGLEIGGDDYMVKPFSPRELVARVRAVLRRFVRASVGDSTEIKNIGPFVIDSERKQIRYAESTLDLSRYEYGILRVLLNNPGRVLSREQIMNAVWEEPEMSLERVVDSHIKSIRAKLKEVGSKDEWILTHRGFGYSLKE